MKNSDLKFLSLGVLGLGAMSCQQAVAERPNVVVIFADDIGYGDLSCNGTSRVQTPNVDRLAAEGVRFTNAHATSSISTASRYGLLTGQYPWRKEGTGIAPGDAGMIISPDQYTLADLFQSAGYTTGAVGKWHLGLGKTSEQNWNGVISPGLCDIGFDYSFIMAATADRTPCVYIENQRVAGLNPADPIYVSYEQNFEGEPTGKDNPELLRLHPSHGHDQSIVNGISRIGYMKGGKAALWKDEDIADRITDHAVQFIGDNKEHPFFLYFGTNDIHVPRAPHKRFEGKSGMGARGDAILSFDYCVGRVLRTLDSLGIRDNTIVILSSDNGPVIDDGYQDHAAELLGDHKPWGRYRGGKYSAFEAGTRIPLLVSWGKHVQAGNVSDVLCSQIDIFASLGALCGIALPENAAPDSRNRADALLGKGTDREYAASTSLTETPTLIMGRWKYIAPSKRAKYIKQTDTELGNDPKPQLYDIASDFGERNNLAEEQSAKLTELQTKMAEVFCPDLK